MCQVGDCPASCPPSSLPPGCRVCTGFLSPGSSSESVREWGRSIPGVTGRKFFVPECKKLHICNSDIVILDDSSLLFTALIIVAFMLI
jgi:hypothetical protein